MSGDRDIEAQVRDWATDVADQLPAWRPEQRGDRRPRARRSRSVVALVASVAVLAAVGWWAGAERDRTVSTGGAFDASDALAGGRAVDYERFEYSVTGADLACPGRLLAGNTVSTAPTVFEAWADQGDKVWKNVVTYPNGGTREVVAAGSPFYPTELYVGGVEAGPAVGCEDPAIGVLAIEPALNYFTSLNPLDDIPTMIGPSGQAIPMVRGYDSAGVRQVQPTVDSRARSCTIWRHEVSGSIGPGRAVRQQIDWCVEDREGKVLELTWTNGLDGIGVAVTLQTLTDQGTRTVPGDFFSTAGLRREPGAEFPHGPPSAGAGSASATTVADAVPDTLPCPAGMNLVAFGRTTTENGHPVIVAPSTSTDDPRQAVLDQWRGDHASDELDFELAGTAISEEVALFAKLNGRLVAQFFLHHDGTGLVLDRMVRCGQKGPPPMTPTSGTLPADRGDTAAPTPTRSPPLDCVSGKVQSTAPGSVTTPGVPHPSPTPFPVEAPDPEDAITAARSALADQPITPADAAPATFELAEQSTDRAVVHARSGDRLVAVVRFRTTGATWTLDGMDACYER